MQNLKNKYTFNFYDSGPDIINPTPPTNFYHKSKVMICSEQLYNIIFV